ncbi:hypothetical protein O6H91_07G061800 [Diphasiastrum complanatum]|uniref:Uncharacterized protein n=1 Tax=Diphasiastrum complanatum TaxID=34168 RepID=A0ACC2D656_DIPCM|nr:hypothetical protein O6H91_07G061800 [Diphasiastrum complanatum]
MASSSEQNRNIEGSMDATPPEMMSCRRRRDPNASFVADLRDHFDEFVHASMDEHTNCFKKTLKKMFGMSKNIPAATSQQASVDSVLPLKVTTSE